MLYSCFDVVVVVVVVNIIVIVVLYMTIDERMHDGSWRAYRASVSVPVGGTIRAGRSLKFLSMVCHLLHLLSNVYIKTISAQVNDSPTHRPMWTASTISTV